VSFKGKTNMGEEKCLICDKNKFSPPIPYRGRRRRIRSRVRTKHSCSEQVDEE